MRALIMVAFSFVLTACGGGTNTPPPPIPNGSVSGLAFDGLLSGGIVRIYDFTTGSKGSLLAQTTSSNIGFYSVSLQVESRALLVEVTGGAYIEEASGTQITLLSAQKLTALVNYTTGTSIQVAVTNFTHLAAGLAAYNIKNGIAVSTAIADANKRLTNWIGFNVITTLPKQINDPANASVSLSPELKAGFLSGAISSWTAKHTTTTVHAEPFTSIHFVQLMYQDITTDGLLDGKGLDSGGLPIQLGFDLTPLDVDVYRYGLGVSLLQMANNTNNKTGITGIGVLAYVINYIANTDAMFNEVRPKTITGPTVSLTSPIANAWVSKVISLSSVQASIGMSKLELLVDGTAVTTYTNYAAPAFTLNTVNYADGVHAIGVRATDIVGQVTTSSVQVLFDNTPPTSTPLTGTPTGIGTGTFYGCASDAGSGVLSVTDVTKGSALTLDTNGCWAANESFVSGGQTNFLYLLRDKTNNCATYAYSINTGGSFVSSGACQ